jgi:type I restriction enzyme S subunit
VNYQSGIEWLGRVPEDWEIAPLYSRYEVALGKMLDSKRVTGQHLAPYLRNVDVQWDSVNVERLPEMDFSPGDRLRYELKEGDLLVCEGGEVGRTAMWSGELEECYYQKAIHRLRPLRSEQCPRFFYYMMRAAADLGVFVAGSNPNTIDHLTAVQLRHHRFPFPPGDEQHAIASFLDRETAKIDALIDKKQRLIELLQEKRTAMVGALVAGNNSYPEVRLGHLIDLLPGYAFPGSEFSRDEEDIRLLRGTNVAPGCVNWTETVRWPAAESARFERYQLAVGDVVLGMDRPWISSGIRIARVQATDLPALLLQRVARIRSRDRLDQDFLELLLGSPKFKGHFEPILTGVSVPHISPEQIRIFRFGLPPKARQIEAVAEFATWASKAQALRLQTEESLRRLREYRTALVSAAVTGKIDVREELE